MNHKIKFGEVDLANLLCILIWVIYGHDLSLPHNDMRKSYVYRDVTRWQF